MREAHLSHAEVVSGAYSVEPEVVFHYTDAAGLLGVLSTMTLWATDLRFLNDAQESIYARDLMMESVRSMDNPVRSKEHWAHEMGDHAAETFEKYQGFILDEMDSSEFGVYVTCFCESGDLLSQWRAYGSDHGYAIGFNVVKLREVVDELSTYPGAKGVNRVRYGIDAAKDVITMGLDSLSRFNLNHPGVKAHYAALEVTSLLALMKHPGFAEEREWRLFAGWEHYRRVAPDQVTPIEPLKFRAAKMALIPYVELPIPRNAIESIRVGPGNYVDVREAGVNRLLSRIGHGASVLRSDLPLRT